MIRSLVRLALEQPVGLCFVLVLFVGVGWNAFRVLPVEAFPDVTDTQVTVITLYPGRAAEEVEKAVTIPVEIELAGLPHSLRVFSHTQFGLSYVIVTFDDDADPYFARQQVLERLGGAELPEGVTPQLAALSTPIGEIFRYRLSGAGLDATELRTLEDWVVEKHLRQVPGVAEIVTSGGFVKQYQLTLDLARMKSFDVTLQQLFAALERSNANAGGSYVERGEQQLLIRGIGLLRSWEDIGNVVVAQRKGSPVLVRHVGKVEVSAMPRQGICGQDDDDEAVTGIVLMRKGENPSDVLTGVKAKVKLLNERILPQGVTIKPFYDRAWLIGTTLRTVFHNLVEGAALVALVLFLFLGRLKPAGIVACLIPLALLGTFIALRLRGIPANLLSLGAMDFGIIVDGAVIVVENVCRRLALRHHLDVNETVLDATVQVGRPTFFSMLIIITAHLPIFFLQRHEGRIFAPMAYTVCAALIGSLVFSLTLVPLLCALLLKGEVDHHEPLIVRAAAAVYRVVLRATLAMPRTLIVVALTLLVFSIQRVGDLGTEFLPELNEGSLWVNLMLPPGISIKEAQLRCAQVRESAGVAAASDLVGTRIWSGNTSLRMVWRSRHLGLRLRSACRRLHP